MQTPRSVTGRRNALERGRELVARVEEASSAPPEAVYDVLADLRTHLVWAGERQHERTRIASIAAPEGLAMVGTEFESHGLDPMGRFHDRSVVTEASRPIAFGFVTEARLQTKAGRPVDWTIVHRYAIDRVGDGSRITYTVSVTRISELPGMLAVFKIPLLSGFAMRASSSVARRGLRNLARMAEERTEEAGDPATTGRRSTMTTEGYVRLPGEGESYWLVGAKGTIKGPNVYELENPPGWEVPLHVHDAEDEVHYYLEGEVEVTCGADTFKAEPGSLAFLPRGVPHALKFGDSSRGRWLWISPENRDGLLRDAGAPGSLPEPAEGDVDMEAVVAVFERHGMRFLEESGH